MSIEILYNYFLLYLSENEIGRYIINNSSIGIKIMCVISQNSEVMHIRDVHSLFVGK